MKTKSIVISGFYVVWYNVDDEHLCIKTIPARDMEEAKYKFRLMNRKKPRQWNVEAENLTAVDLDI